jgi:transcriptional regulator with XRE-family HTH domain
MSNTRTPSESEALKKEAERRVRAGENRTDVARRLGLSPSTLSNWAADGGWRRKDIDSEINAERGRIMLEKIAEIVASDHQEAAERTAKSREVSEAAFARLRSADPENSGALPGLKPPTGRQLAMTVARRLLEQGDVEEAERAARIAIRFAQAERMTGEADRDLWIKDRANVMKWWEENREGFIAVQEWANDLASELDAVKAREMALAEHECCPTCTRPMEFWPAAMQQKMEAIAPKLPPRTPPEPETAAQTPSSPPPFSPLTM